MNGGQLAEDQHRAEELVQSFECNICYGICQEPVVTTCGHLYCWPCIYQWVNTNRTYLTCPVCKNGITENRIISIFSKSDRPAKSDNAEERHGIPERPKHPRFEP